ncbi:MAG TPA: ABC transporter permease [Puia sp.]|nr:ABC transporter permease [Puia sp.]
MLVANWKIAARNLARNKTYALINIGGLAIGIASCLLIFLIIQFETSFDDFHTDRDRIYRVITAQPSPRGIDYGSGVPFPTPAALRRDYPSIGQVSSILAARGTILINGEGPEKKFKDNNIFYADPEFFKTFNFPLIAGNAATALASPYTVLLTRETAQKFFGDWHMAMGKVIRLDNKTNLTIRGVLADIPENSDYPLHMVVSLVTQQQPGADYAGMMTDWVSIFGGNYCFIKLAKHVLPATVERDLAAMVRKYRRPEDQNVQFHLQPFTDMHYNTDISIFTRHPFSRTLIDAIAALGLFLVVIACVNFINLATARAVQRSKEVGVRKVMGSTRIQLVRQFLTETLLITLVACALAISIAAFVLPYLNTLLDIKLDGLMLMRPGTLLFMLAASVVVTLLAGFYPAIVLSGFTPIGALRNRFTSRRTKGPSLRRVLVVLQFVISQVLVIGTLVILFQLNFFATQPLGFDKDAVINVPFLNDSTGLTKLDALRNELAQLAGVRDVSYSFSSPSDQSTWSSAFKFDHSAKETTFDATLHWADPEYFRLYGMRFIAGHAYPASPHTHGYVVNQALLRELGIRDPAQAIGKQINLWDDTARTGPIVGVVTDYATTSLSREIPPVLHAAWKDVYQVINIKLQGSDVSQTLASIQRLWNQAFPAGVYEYSFLDARIAGFYKAQRQLANLIKIFAGLAIFISCLGLYGLVSFMAVQRTREVGIRKTLGASVGNIIYLFSREFTVLILLAFAIASPVGWFIMHRWLENFHYRITIGPLIFILAILASALIAWLAVGYRALAAALANPVKALRTE